jgi:hypothetical protein
MCVVGKILVFFVYVLGLGSLMLCDLLVTKLYGVEDVAQWAQIRSLVGIAAIPCLLGLDQVLVRSPQSSARLLTILSVQVPLLGILSGLLIWSMGLISSWQAGALLAIGSAGSLVFFQYFRSHHHRMKSQISQQGWKILALIIVGSSVFINVDLNLQSVVIGVIWASVILSVLFLCISPPRRMREQSPEKASQFYDIGSRFMVSSLFLALSVYAEQLVVNHYGGAHNGAFYFTHATYFLFPVSLVTGYFAFLIGPWIRDNHEKFFQIVQTRRLAIFGGVLALGIVVQMVGWLAWVVVNPIGSPPDIWLQIAFLMICMARMVYTLPAGYLGVFGQPRQHDRLIVGQALSLIVAGSVFYACHFVFGVSIIYAVGYASAVNWVLRTGVGTVISEKIMTTTFGGRGAR